jgi:small-conductance mechanosensitive channel
MHLGSARLVTYQAVFSTSFTIQGAIVMRNSDGYIAHEGVTAMRNRDAYIAKMRLQLDELNAAIDELEAREHESGIGEMSRDGVSKLLRSQSQLTTDKLEELSVANEDSWKHLIADTEKMRDTFTNSFHYFKSRL